MPGLPELQAGMRLAVLGHDRSEIVAAILGDGLDPTQRLAIHRNNVRITLTEALKATFATVCRLVDERFLAYAAAEFIKDHPPQAPCLFEYGAEFPAFLDGFEPCRGVPYIGDVARLEWAINEALHAVDLPPLPAEAFSEIPVASYPDLVLGLDPSLRLVRSDWPVGAIWLAHQGEGEPKPVALDAGGATLLIRRRGDRIDLEELGEGAFAFIAALLWGRRLSVAAEAGLAADPFFDLAITLRRLIGEGAIVRTAVLPPNPRRPEP